MTKASLSDSLLYTPPLNNRPYSSVLCDAHLTPFFSRKNWVSWHQNVSILDFIEVKRNEVGVTAGAIRRPKLQSHHHHQHTISETFLQAGCPSCRPTTVSEHWGEESSSLSCHKLYSVRPTPALNPGQLKRRILVYMYIYIRNKVFHIVFCFDAFIKAAVVLNAENRLTYSITSGNVGNAFEVAPDVGEIKVRGHLDYENGPRVGSAVEYVICLVTIWLELCTSYSSSCHHQIHHP